VQNGYPSWFESDWSDLSQDAYSTLRIHTPELVAGRYWIGVYAFRGATGFTDEASFTISASAAVRCLNDCSGQSAARAVQGLVGERGCRRR